MKFFTRKKELKDGLAWYPTINHLGRQYSFGGWPTKKAAEARGKVIIDLVAANSATTEEEALVLEQLAAGTFGQDNQDLKFSDLYQRWISAKSQSKKASTIKSIKSAYKNHLEGFFGETRLSEITPLMIQEWVSEMGEKDLSPATTGKVYRYFRACIRQGYNWDLISVNPCRGIELPRVEKGEMEFIDPSDISRLLEQLRDPYRTLTTVLAFSGIRLGEALGLAWKHIDFEHNAILIERAVEFHTGELQDPKTPAARRAVVMLPALKPVLQDYHGSQEDPDPDDFLFTREDGRPLSTSTVEKKFAKAVEASKLKDVPLHSLRHTLSSSLLASGASIKALQRTLGHTTATMTLDTYSHLLQEDIESAAAKASQLLTGGEGKLRKLNRLDEENLGGT